jgi:hypothetical protein
MNSRARIKWNPDGLYLLRSSPGVRADLEARGRRVLEAAGGTAAGFAMSSQQGQRRPQGRWRVTVITANRFAKRLNAKNNTLIHALEAAKG